MSSHTTQATQSIDLAVQSEAAHVQALDELCFLESLTDPVTLTRQLNAVFGVVNTARTAGYEDPKIAYRWSRPGGAVPAEEALRRLYAANRIWSEVQSERTHAQAAAWFVAPHPRLGNQQPIELIAEGKFADVSAVSRRDEQLPIARLKAAGPEFAAFTAYWHERSLSSTLDVVKSLAERFGAPSVSAMAGESNIKAAYRWIKNEGKLPTGVGCMQIFGVYRAVIAMEDVFTPPVARAWFLAANRSLGEQSPLETARRGNFKALLVAADQMLYAVKNRRNNK